MSKRAIDIHKLSLCDILMVNQRQAMYSIYMYAIMRNCIVVFLVITLRWLCGDVYLVFPERPWFFAIQSWSIKGVYIQYLCHYAKLQSFSCSSLCVGCRPYTDMSCLVLSHEWILSLLRGAIYSSVYIMYYTWAYYITTIVCSELNRHKLCGLYGFILALTLSLST